MNTDILFAIALLLLGLEHFAIPIPAWITGILLIIVAVLMLF